MTSLSYADDTMPLYKRGLVRGIELLTGQPLLARLYEEYQAVAATEDFWSGAVRRLQLDLRYDHERLAQFPRTGPAVMVANHPYGVMDGIILGWLAHQIRPDFKILTNAVLYRAPEARPWLLPIDFAGTQEALETNITSRRAAHEHLAQGGAILVFPAGGVSTSPDRLGRAPASDAPWQAFVGQLVQKHRTPVLPVFFEGQNSRLFQIASHVSLTLRLSLLFKEVRDRIGTPVDIRIGTMIPFAEIAAIRDRKALSDELRRRTYALAGDPQPKTRRRWLRRG